MTNLGTLALVTALVAGQAERPSEHLKLFQPLIGQWVHVGAAQSDSVAFGPKGTEFRAVMTFTWAINKNAVQIRWSGKAAEKEAVQFVELVGWNAKQDKLISHGFSSLGAVEHNVWSRNGNTVICDCQGINAEGKDVSIRYLNTVDGDTLDFRITDVVVDGEKQPDEEYKYHRIR
jgi:hypothetical protein